MINLIDNTGSVIVSEEMKEFAKALKKKPKLRKRLMIASGIIDILIIVVYTIIELFFEELQLIEMFLIFIGIAFAFILLCCFLSFIIGENNLTLNEQLSELKEEREELNKKIEKETKIIDVNKINLNQLTEYYTINKGQARKSYALSIIMISVGFICVIVGIGLCYAKKVEVNVAIISGISGLISEFIGATSLLLYKENSRQANMFFQELSYLQQVMLAIELSNKLCEQKREEEISIIISEVIKRDTKQSR